jgi:hypothetical protein
LFSRRVKKAAKRSFELESILNLLLYRFNAIFSIPPQDEAWNEKSRDTTLPWDGHGGITANAF